MRVVKALSTLVALFVLASLLIVGPSAADQQQLTNGSESPIENEPADVESDDSLPAESEFGGFAGSFSADEANGEDPFTGTGRPETLYDSHGYHLGLAPTSRPQLGGYGPMGPIMRADLREGLRDYVADGALVVAASSELSKARADWDRGVDFVDQVDYQLSFRRGYDFLSTEPSHLASVLEDKLALPPELAELGLFLTAEEQRELIRRDALGSHMDRLRTVAELARAPRAEAGTSGSSLWSSGIRGSNALPLRHHDNLVEIWQDQLAGGVLVMAVRDERLINWSGIERIVSREEVTVVEVPFSSRQYDAFRAELTRQLDDLGIDYTVSTRRSSQEGLTIEVTVETPAGLPGEFGTGVPTSAFEVGAGQIGSPINDPQDDHAWDRLHPGQGLIVQDSGTSGGCTWGATGHTSNWNYIVTAGHCLDEHENSSDWVGNDVEVYTGNPDDFTKHKLLTPGSVFVHSRNDTRDAARILSKYANTNCYHGTEDNPAADCAWAIKQRASHNSWEIDSDRTCASLARSNTYRCGKITDHKISQSGTTGLVEVDFRGAKGDSGAGAKWGSTLDGIIVQKRDRVLRKDRVLMQTAYHVKQALGSSFDFNCAPSPVRRDADEWGSCPVINR